MGIEKIVIGHSIMNQDNSIMNQDNLDYFDLLSNFNLGLEVISFYVVTYLIAFLLFLLLIDLSERMNQTAVQGSLLRRGWLTMRNFLCHGYSFSSIGVFFMFLHLFLWLNELFLTNNIKTNKVSFGSRGSF